MGRLQDRAGVPDVRQLQDRGPAGRHGRIRHATVKLTSDRLDAQQTGTLVRTMRRNVSLASLWHLPRLSRGTLRLRSQLRTLVRSLVDAGITGREPPDLIKPLRLCNTVSVVAFAIMMTWALFEIGAGNLGNLEWELGLALGFATCPLLNALGRHRAARIALILVANGTIFVGAVMFNKGSGGSLPFVAMIALPVLLSRPSEKLLLVGGAAVTVTL